MAIHPTVVAAVVAVTCVAGSQGTLAAGMLDQGEHVPEAAVVSGVPQGIFIGRSLLTGRAVCLLFLGGGRITRAIPEGGLEHFDWARHKAAHPRDSGRWEMRGNQLVVAWGDGGVHQGPLTVHPDSIEFYGKRYAKPIPVRLGAIAGRWESARGTAIAGGPGINAVNTLIISADGHYQWQTTNGGVVGGRAVAGEDSTSGEVLLTGMTITFAPKGGALRSYTFLAAAGQPVTAFSIDANLFTRER